MKSCVLMGHWTSFGIFFFTFSSVHLYVSHFMIFIYKFSPYFYPYLHSYIHTCILSILKYIFSYFYLFTFKNLQIISDIP